MTDFHDPHDPPHPNTSPPSIPTAEIVVPAPTPRDPQDRGSPKSALIAILALFLLIPAVVFIQQVPPPEEPEESITEGLTPAPSGGQFELQGRIMLKVAHGIQGTGQGFLPQLNSVAASPGDEIRYAIAVGQILDSESALAELQGIDPGDDDEIDADLDAMYNLYANGSDSLDDDERERIETRYGWFGELALLHDHPDAPELDTLLSGGVAIMVLLITFVLGLGFGLIAGLVLLVVAIINASNGKLRPAFVPPTPGGSVYLEMFAVFVASFLAIKLIGDLIAPSLSPDNAVRITLLLQWCMVAVLFYPLIRGVPLARMKQDLGLHTGVGIFREIGAGITAYIAGIPVYFGSVLVSLLLVLLWGMIVTGADGEPTAPDNPIFDIVEKAGPIELLLFITLATIWAPLMEETIFRGGLFRHMRSRLHWIAAAFFSAALFGVMHGYFFIMLIPIVTLGALFAAIRQWRGSLIAPMTAHFIHNSVTLGLVTVMIRLLST